MDGGRRPEDPRDARRLARRALLRRALWVVPAVVGTFIVSRTAAAVSCVPQGACGPDQCGPNFVPCGPAKPCKPGR
jgi:hypothetical protein